MKYYLLAIIMHVSFGNPPSTYKLIGVYDTQAQCEYVMKQINDANNGFVSRINPPHICSSDNLEQAK